MLGSEKPLIATPLGDVVQESVKGPRVTDGPGRDRELDGELVPVPVQRLDLEAVVEHRALTRLEEALEAALVCIPVARWDDRVGEDAPSISSRDQPKLASAWAFTSVMNPPASIEMNASCAASRIDRVGSPESTGDAALISWLLSLGPDTSVQWPLHPPPRASVSQVG